MACRLDPRAVMVTGEYRDKEAALESLVNLTCDVYDIPDHEEVIRSIIERESKLSTGMGLGVAVPHSRFDAIEDIIISVLLIPEGIDYNAVDGRPVKLMVMILSSPRDVGGYLAFLSSLAQAVSDDDTRSTILSVKDAGELYQRILPVLSSCIHS